MSGKGDKRRPESVPGSYNQGYDEIKWSQSSKTTSKNNKKKVKCKIS